MQTVSSCGVEARKQNIPIRQTLGLYRSAVSYLTEIYEQVWEELEEIPDAKRRFNAAEHLVHTTKKILHVLILTSASRRCHPTSEELQSGMHWEVYLLTKHGWICGQSQEKKQGCPNWCMRTMPCLFFTVVSCTEREQKEKRKHT